MMRNSSKSDEKESEEAFSVISLRPFDLSDVDDFMVWATEDRVCRVCSVVTFTCREDAVNYIKVSFIPHPWCRAICIKNRPIGFIKVAPNTDADICRGDLGYAIASKYWGHGIATQAVKMVVSSIFSEWPHLERLQALVDVENPASQRVLEKAGFQREGVFRKFFIHRGRTRDMVIFSSLSTEPKL
ncbi:hypothetical protein HHK36_022736 [Tetracentron sinense]|uniref:N-acetyltransferase domain-containing protein n=1 Tax=Tetracentron sinense TaxID=13715 RepID=A0A834YNE3_TETSI|nr:hypothetical protein HHK36_022736 [Tetracentron sinense]